MRTRITALLGIEHPIFQAAMSWASSCSELVIAVFSAFFSPARTALLPNLVHPDQLLRANSMTNAAGTIASLRP